MTIGSAPQWRKSVGAAFAYAASGFSAGFGLGAMRVTLLAPRVGATVAVLLEAPVILTASWYLSKVIIARFRVPAEFGPRALMGATAFAVLMGCELALSALIFDRSASQFALQYAGAPGLIGLAAQVCFAVFPLCQTARE